MNRSPPQPGPATDGSTEPIVRLVGLHKRFGRLRVLKRVTIDFDTGKTTVVLGPSGCGKSVMLKHVIGLIRPTSGEVWFEQVRVDVLSEAKLEPIRRQFGFLFQHSALFDSLSVSDNVSFPLREHTSFTDEERRERVHDVLRMVELEHLVDKMPAELSGGQRKRIALARAIVLRPRVILYDEPTTGLDPIRADAINELILKLQSELHTSAIVVTHDLASAFRIADEMIMLYDGRVILQGSPDEFRSSSLPVVRQFLKGDATSSADELMPPPPAPVPDDSGRSLL